MFFNTYAILRIRFALLTHDPQVLRTLAPVVPKTSGNTGYIKVGQYEYGVYRMIRGDATGPQL
eukprot:1196554-Pyramimonas_sp.AAC.1